RRRRQPDDRREPDPARLDPGRGRDGDSTAEGPGRDRHRQDEHARVRLGRDLGEPALRLRPQPVGARALPPPIERWVPVGRPGARGTDPGGPSGLPSAINGIVGIRPTIGRVSNFNVIPLAWSMDTVGPMARTVQDCAVMFNAIAGHDPRDAASASVPTTDYT